MMKRRSAAAAVLAMVVSSIALSGCSDFPGIDASVGFDGEHLLFANCDEDIRGRFDVAVAARGEQSTFETVFAAGTETGWPNGAVISTDDSTWDEVEESEPPVLEANELVAIFVDADGDTRVARFSVPLHGLEPGQWVRADGSRSRTPCAKDL